MKVSEKDIEIKGSVEYIRDRKRYKRILFRKKGEIRVRAIEVDAEKEYTEDELFQLICEVMQNEQ